MSRAFSMSPKFSRYPSIFLTVASTSCGSVILKQRSPTDSQNIPSTFWRKNLCLGKTQLMTLINLLNPQIPRCFETVLRQFRKFAHLGTQLQKVRIYAVRIWLHLWPIFYLLKKKEAKFTELERKFQIHFYFKRALYATINLSFAKKKF